MEACEKRNNYDIMSVSEREQTKFVHRERRMAIMIAAKAASSTEGANHDIMSVSEPEACIPVDLVKEIRLNKSIELIKNTDLSVSEIAFAVGFKDSGYYSKCFRKKYNQSPREYMNEWRKGER